MDKSLTILASIHGAHDGGKQYFDGLVDSIIECGLFPKVKRGIYKKGKRVGEEHLFHYGRRCQNGEHCELCNHLNVSDGLKELLFAYDEAAFHGGGNWFALTVAPRTDAAQAHAVGRMLTPKDWNHENPQSVIFRESRSGRAFVYPNAADANESYDWAIESQIRRFLVTLGKLVKNGWLDGVRARVENSVQFLPYASHQYWHAVGSSKFEHDLQAMADFIKEEVDAIMAETSPGLFADVMVAQIPSPKDLTRWIRYMNKTVNLVEAVESVYKNHPNMVRGDALFEDFYEELLCYLERSSRVFGMIRVVTTNERGKHTYRLNRRYVKGNHQFGNVSILSESERHERWRKDHAKTENRRRAKRRRSARKLQKKRLKQKGQQEQVLAEADQRSTGRRQRKRPMQGRTSHTAPGPLRRNENPGHPQQQTQSQAPRAKTSQDSQASRGRATERASPKSMPVANPRRSGDADTWAGRAAFGNSLRDQLRSHAPG